MRNARYSVSELSKIARKKNGKLLSKKYVNVHSDLKWQCKKGHIWKAPAAGIISGRRWCPECGREASRRDKIKYNIHEMQKLALRKGGKCISKKYLNYSQKLEWQCKEKHTFFSPPSKIIQGNWCPFCIGRGKTIKTLSDIARARGGKCLSEKYPGARNKARWQCKYGHKWESSPDNVINKLSWCPHCSTGKGETLVRIALEQLFKVEFPKTRPDWLRYNGRKLELDGYCKKLNLAFEHHGAFHYQKITKFNQTSKEFEKRQSLDKIKKRECKKRGITLIEVPEVGNLLSVENLTNFLVTELLRCKIKLPKNFTEFVPDYESAWIHPDHDRLETIRKKVSSKGGKLISKEYLGSTFKYKIECEIGHIFATTWGNIKQGKWCPTCNGNKVITIGDMNRIAINHGGKCLSKRYFNNLTHLAWECSKGHQWAASPTNIMRGTWCPACNTGKMPDKKKLNAALKKTI